MGTITIEVNASNHKPGTERNAKCGKFKSTGDTQKNTFI